MIARAAHPDAGGPVTVAAMPRSRTRRSMFRPIAPELVLLRGGADRRAASGVRADGPRPRGRLRHRVRRRARRGRRRVHICGAGTAARTSAWAAWSRVDGFAVFVLTVILLAATLLALLLASHYSTRGELERAEYYALMLFSPPA